VKDMNFLASRYLGNLDYDNTLKWYKKSVDKGDQKAMYEIANLYEHYIEISQQAIQWYKKAAKAHYPDAMEQLSKLMQTTYGNDTIAMYKKEIEAGRDVYWNMQFLANFYMRLEQFDKAKEVYKEVIKKFPDEKAEMLFAIGNLYRKSWLDDKEKEINYYKQSAALGNKQAMFNLGIYYGDLKNYKKAEEYFKQSDHNRMVCYMYKTKLKDNNRALSCYENEEKTDNPISVFALGFFYDETLKDYDQAIKSYKKAYELGYSGGALNIGYIYREHLNNRKKGIYWYHKAADMGEDGAIRYLMREGEL
ncbi:tetratricopeptide repeat protein, partial [Sulfurovum sp.]|uniref:tetratricopeptide repeat protein n=1 Tax=Sulfurovum sp. TaxID=1969726 RepID=UPI003561C5F2